MHLPKLPTIFVKNGEERKAFFTVQARELLAAGWVEKEEAPATKEPKNAKQVKDLEKSPVTKARKKTPKAETPKPLKKAIEEAKSSPAEEENG